MSERNDRLLLLKTGLGVFGILAVLYSLLVATRPLLGVVVALLVFSVYLAWRFYHLAIRFVRAIERIADATEARER